MEAAGEEKTQEAVPEQKEITLSTSYGKVRGLFSDPAGEVVSFRGIRYGRARRYAFAEEVFHAGEEVYDATAFGACPYQHRAFLPETRFPEGSAGAFYYHEFREGVPFTYSDDCLSLNIWTKTAALPAAAVSSPEGLKTGVEKNLPVAVFFYGGSFTEGSSDEKTFSGEAWAARDVILVTVNYRVGPFGLLCLPEIKKQYGHTGNICLLDQFTAMMWLHHHIASFGGDPDNITLMGQSAGAISVQEFIGSPLTEGRYAKTIQFSLGGASRILDTGSRTPEKNYPFWEEVVREAAAEAGVYALSDYHAVPNPQIYGEGFLDVLREIPPDIMEKAFLSVEEKRRDSTPVEMPVKDGYFITHSSVEVRDKKLFHPCPAVISVTKNDLAAPILRSMSRRFTRIMKSAGISAFEVRFNRLLPGDKKGAFHSSDLWYIFGTLKNSWRPFTKEDYDLSARMIDYYTSFAKTGKPEEAAEEGPTVFDVQE